MTKTMIEEIIEDLEELLEYREKTYPRWIVHKSINRQKASQKILAIKSALVHFRNMLKMGKQLYLFE